MDDKRIKQWYENLLRDGRRLETKLNIMEQRKQLYGEEPVWPCTQTRAPKRICQIRRPNSAEDSSEAFSPIIVSAERAESLSPRVNPSLTDELSPFAQAYLDWINQCIVKFHGDQKFDTLCLVVEQQLNSTDEQQ